MEVFAFQRRGIACRFAGKLRRAALMPDFCGFLRNPGPYLSLGVPRRRGELLQAVLSLTKSVVGSPDERFSEITGWDNFVANLRKGNRK